MTREENLSPTRQHRNDLVTCETHREVAIRTVLRPRSPPPLKVFGLFYWPLSDIDLSASLSSTQWHLDRLLEIFCARDLHVFWPLKILDGSHRTELHRQPSLRTFPALCPFAPVGCCDSSCCSASRPIPSPSFNTESAET